MKLPDHLIRKCIKEKNIIISPFSEQNIRPVGVRIHLGDEIFVYENNQIIDVAANQVPKYKRFNIETQHFELKPNQFILAHTKEKIWTNKNILCSLDGRTTIARLGLSIHKTAKIADGTQTEMQSIVLEIYNHSNVTYFLKSGIPIGMVTFEFLAEPVSGNVKAGVNTQGIEWELSS